MLITTATLALALSCPKTEIIDKIPHKPWGLADKFALNTAANTCAKKYKNSPCLIKFTRSEERTYHAICGAPVHQHTYGKIAVPAIGLEELHRE